MSPPAIKKVAMEAKPIVTAVVTPSKRRTSTPAKIANITMADYPSYSVALTAFKTSCMASLLASSATFS